MSNRRFGPQDLAQAEKWFRQGIPEKLADKNGRTLSGIATRQDEHTRVEQEERFAERSEYLAQRNLHLTPSAVFANQLSVVFPSVPGYGPEHGKNVSQLACYIAEVNNVSSVSDLETVKTAGLMHDVARATPWNVSDPNHAVRSAELADRFMRADPAGAHSPLRDAVCRLIARHANPEPGNILAEALRDADLLEAARHAPNSAAGFRAAQDAFKRLNTRWAQDPAAARKWLAKHGWDLKTWVF